MHGPKTDEIALSSGSWLHRDVYVPVWGEGTRPALLLDNKTQSWRIPFSTTSAWFAPSEWTKGCTHGISEPQFCVWVFSFIPQKEGSTKSKEEEHPTMTASQRQEILDEETVGKDCGVSLEWGTLLSLSLYFTPLKIWYHYNAIHRCGWPRKLRKKLRGSNPSESVVIEEVSKNSSLK